ncbi:TetR/AcrR family transcriptional regulator [Peterkaempfera sp. SMS 1(5)a]|uniref:TetR/AcrR family transcriptional regulator n=1 Tax=Peterkaempfera podocarpi TaxID=3232308 RepID=UPI00366B56CD
MAAAIRAQRPDLDEGDAVLLGWCALAVLVSPSYHRRDLPRPRFEELLSSQAAALCRSGALPSAARQEPPEEPAASGLSHHSRREALLAAAIPLFKERGFQLVSMEEIGAAAGIAGPSIYNHFASKTEILTAALHRETEVLHFALARELAESRTPEEALRRVVHSYAALCGMHSSAVPLLVSELSTLPPERQQSAHQAQVDFVAECVALLRRCRPDLSESEAPVAISAVLTMVLIVSRLPRSIRGTTPPGLVAALAMDALGVGDRR